MSDTLKFEKPSAYKSVNSSSVISNPDQTEKYSEYETQSDESHTNGFINNLTKNFKGLFVSSK